MKILTALVPLALFAVSAQAAIVPFRPPYAKQVTFKPFQVVAGQKVKIICILGSKPQLQVDTNTPLGEYLAHHKPNWTLPLEFIVNGAVIHTSDEPGMASDSSTRSESTEWTAPASFAGKTMKVECAIDRKEKKLPSSASANLGVLKELPPKFRLKDQHDQNVTEPPGGPILPPSATGTAAGSDIPPAQVKLPDITSRPMVGVAGHSVPWGGSVSITAAQARGMANGRCLVAFEHFARNSGATPTGGFKRRWRNEATHGSATGVYPPIAAAQFVRRVDTLELVPGSNHLRLALDSSDQVAEAREDNNVFDVTVQVAGACGETKQTLGTEIEKILQ